MRFVFYTHSLVSDWNHGNAHFLRGLMRSLQAKGHETLALEPDDGWSRANLEKEHGASPDADFAAAFPGLVSRSYGHSHDHEAECEAADVVVVHEWTDPGLVAHLGRLRARGGRFVLLFHDTHHRAVSREPEIAGLDLDGYDGVLAFGEALKERYLGAGWGRQVETFHEAADIDLFHPSGDVEPEEDLVWIGNWGDGERSEELRTFLIEPARRLRLTGSIHGVRYPREALEDVGASGLTYRGWLANHRVPDVFARHRVTVHVPRRPYVDALPGIPTIRVFEALACGIPLVSAPWDDREGLFRPGQDFLFAADGGQMERHLRAVLNEPALAESLRASGLETIRARHSCAHRADQLLRAVARYRPTLSEAAE
jgi:spore maturation protein CgeB